MRELRDSVLRAVSLVVTDRRWAAPLSAMALGFGLFLGVAIGPGASGTLATGSNPILALAAPQEDEAPAEAPVEREPTGGGFEAEEPLAEPEPLEPAPAEPEFAPEPPLEAPVEEEPAEEPAGEAPPEEEGETQQLRGTVVHANPAAESYALAIAGGELVSIHAEQLPAPGVKLSVAAEPLPNNTFGEKERERQGSAARATLRGVVTHLDPDPAAPAYTLSGRGSSIRVRVAPAPAPQLPVLGAYATVTAAIEKAARVAADPTLPPAPPTVPVPPPAAEPEPPAPEAPAACVPDPGLKPPPPPTHVLTQRKIETEPEPATYLDLAGIVAAVCPGQLLLSADDQRLGEADLALTVPPEIKTAKLKPGDSILATATLGADGTLTLSGLASDEGERGAADSASAQGDLKR